MVRGLNFLKCVERLARVGVDLDISNVDYRASLLVFPLSEERPVAGWGFGIGVDRGFLGVSVNSDEGSEHFEIREVEEDSVRDVTLVKASGGLSCYIHHFPLRDHFYGERIPYDVYAPLLAFLKSKRVTDSLHFGGCCGY